MIDKASVTRFWSKVNRTEGQGPNGNCWTWLAGRRRGAKGYGNFWLNGRARVASQVAWEIENSQAFPTGAIACHSCDNDACVNPSHIYAGSYATNNQDCADRGRHYNKTKTHCPSGHAYTVDNILPKEGGRSCRECNRIRCAKRHERLNRP